VFFIYNNEASGEVKMNIINDKRVTLALLLKANALCEDGAHKVSASDVAFVCSFKWKHHPPQHLHEAIRDIFTLKLEDVVKVLMHQAIKHGVNSHLTDYDDLLGGNV
jgi:hypothetical protein